MWRWEKKRNAAERIPKIEAPPGRRCLLSIEKHGKKGTTIQCHWIRKTGSTGKEDTSPGGESRGSQRTTADLLRTKEYGKIAQKVNQPPTVVDDTAVVVKMWLTW